jgi:cell division protein FtsN
MFLGIFIGLVLGMLLALGVVWYLRKAPLPFENKYEQTAPAAPADGAPRPLPLPGKKAEGESKPRFDFYGILEGKQNAAPPPDAKPADKPHDAHKDAPKPDAPKPVEQAAAPSGERFYLQVGAFQKATEADNVKAKLTLQGLEAEVVEADIPEKGKMYRVRTGPYNNLDDANRVRHQLAENGTQATMIKIK